MFRVCPHAQIDRRLGCVYTPPSHRQGLRTNSSRWSGLASYRSGRTCLPAVRRSVRSVRLSWAERPLAGCRCLVTHHICFHSDNNRLCSGVGCGRPTRRSTGALARTADWSPGRPRSNPQHSACGHVPTVGGLRGVHEIPQVKCETNPPLPLPILPSPASLPLPFLPSISQLFPSFWCLPLLAARMSWGAH